MLLKPQLCGWQRQEDRWDLLPTSLAPGSVKTQRNKVKSRTPKVLLWPLHIHAQVHTHICHIHTHTYTHVHIYHRDTSKSHTHIYHTHMCTHSHICIHTQIHTLIYTYTHTERKALQLVVRAYAPSVTAGYGIWRLSLFLSGTFFNTAYQPRKPQPLRHYIMMGILQFPRLHLI